MTLKIAVIGVGTMGSNHARIYADLPDVELVGVADGDLSKAETIGRRYRCPVFADYRQLLDEAQPDAVSIVVPTALHLEVALEVIARGIHLLIEKPIAFQIDEGERIIAAAKTAGVKLMIGHIERFNPAVLALKEHLDGGALGRVFQIDAHRQGPYPARVQDVGVVIDLAVHDVDVMRFICKADVERVYAETERQVHGTHEDLLSGLLRMSNGVVGSLTINWLTPTKIRELLVTGERGMYRVDYLTQDLYFYENAIADGSDWETLKVLRGVSEGRMIRHVVAKREPLRSELENFLAVVRGEAAILVTGEDGLQSLAVARGIVTSGIENRVVTFANG